jgi:two-component system LytT family sensor kinase
MRLLLSLAEATGVFFVLFHLYSRTRSFRPLTPDWTRPRARLGLYLFCSLIAILGSYLGPRYLSGGIGNTRAIGAIIAGMLGGPWLGAAVGVTAGAHRLSLGGFSAFAGAVATTLEGIVGGLVHVRVVRRRAPERLVDWKLAAGVTAAMEIVHMGIVLALARPFDEAVALVKIIGIPMIAANSAGAALFMTVLRDRWNLWDKVGAVSSARALRIADRTLGVLRRGGLGGDGATALASVIHEETGVGAVAITGGNEVLAFVGIGSDHHRPGTPIASALTREAMATQEVIFADGVKDHFRCPLSPACRLDSVVVVPLVVDRQVIGTVQLFEPRDQRFLGMNKSLGEGIGAVLANQLLLARYEEQKDLLVLAELKLAHAQVNPHFLFNSLNTIIAVTRRDPERARELLAHLSNFFRKNLKRSSDLSTLAEELEHVGSYLEIEKARFADRLVVETDVDPALLGLRLPTFTLQPLVENAIKHGLSATITRGTTRIRARREGAAAIVDVEDDAGTWDAGGRTNGGLGMQIVEKRLKNLLGDGAALSVACAKDEWTRVSLRIPLGGRP